MWGGQSSRKLNKLVLLISRDLRRCSYPTGGTLDGRLMLIELEFPTYTVEAPA